MKFERAGKEIKKARLKLGLTQKELADEAGLCRATVIAMEHGRTLPRYDKMMRVNEVLKIASNR